MTSQMRIASLLTALTLFSLSSFSPASSAGRTNKSIANTVLSGKGAPTTKIGINGDFYIDITNFNIYGPKANNRWPTAVNLKGPAGNDGKPGERGSSGSGSNGSKGEKGEKGEPGDKGDKGDKGDAGLKGDKGETGLTGAIGLQGATGLTGAQGLKGDKGDIGLTGATGLTGAQGLVGATGATGAQGPKGDKGDTGATGATGATGSQGIQGLKGDTGTTGATGATGPSNVQTGSLTFSGGLQGNAGTSVSSANFGNLEAGKSYVFDVHVRGILVFSGTKLSLTASPMGATPTVTTSWIASTANTYRNLSSQTEFGFVVRIVVNGSATINSYQLAVTVISGSNLFENEQVFFTGEYAGQLVGSISG